MFTAEGLLKLRRWTQHSLTLLLDHVETLPWDSVTRELDGFGFPTIRAQLAHISGAEAFWMHAMQGLKWPGWPYHEAESVAGLRRAFDESHQLIRDFLGRTPQAELAVPRVVHFPSGGAASFSPALVVQHVITHAFHHKGQIVAMTRLLGWPAPETDLDANSGNE